MTKSKLKKSKTPHNKSVHPLSSFSHPSAKPSRNLAKRTLAILVALMVISLVSLGGYYSYFSPKIYPNVYIGKDNVGLLTQKEAVDLISKNLVASPNIKLLAKDKTFELSLSEVSFSYDLENTVNNAYNYGRKGNIIENIYSLITTVNQKKGVNFTVKLDRKKLDEYLAVVSGQLTKEPIAPSAKIVSGQVLIDKGAPGETINKDNLAELLVQKLSSNDFTDTRIEVVNVDESLSDADADAYKARVNKLVSKSLSLENEYDIIPIKDTTLVSFIAAKNNFDEAAINSFVETEVAPKISREPQNAVFRMEGESVQEFVPAKNGFTINKESLIQKIKGSLSQLETSEEKTIKIVVPVQIKEPEITNDSVNNLGIKELIGRGSSRFPGSIPGRIHNVGHAASKFKSVMVAPGETLSFNAVLGDVSSLTGYKQAYVIKDGRTVLGDGGGVCQVSTTLFRAALNAGLPITERHPHSYRVSYYESDSRPGLDATVYAPTSDLKIVNDTPGHILIQSIFNRDNVSLVFEIYGTSDGRVATVTTPVITSQSAPPPDLYVDDPTLPVGQVKQIDHKAWGARVNFSYKVVRNGETLQDKVFYSNYRPWQAVFLRGTKPI